MSSQSYRLILNAGSSSLKFKLYANPENEVVLSGLAERIGEKNGRIKAESSSDKFEQELPLENHQEALKALVHSWTSLTGDAQLGDKIVLVGHRVVHGGESFHEPVQITEQVKDTIRKLSVLAPLHNPANLTGIEACEQIFTNSIQVAVFDTAFHQSMQAKAYRYAVPNKFYQEEGVRVYGFHGTSHKYVSEKAISHLKKEGFPAEKIVTLHLGNGCSMAAVHNGACVDTTMGLSPLAGLMMGTRSGDIDPSIYLFLSKKGYSVEAIDKMLNKESGLVGIAGENDLRELSKSYEKGDKEAVLALEMYTYRIKKFIGAYAASMNGLDAIVFTAGVGENSTLVRKLVCTELSFLGIQLSEQANMKRASSEILNLSDSDATCQILVVPTDEEVEILNESTEFLG